MTLAKWKKIDAEMQKKCLRCGLRGRHVCLPTIDAFAGRKKPYEETASAKVRLARGD